MHIGDYSPFMTKTQAGRRLEVTPATVRTMIKRGELKEYKLGAYFVYWHLLSRKEVGALAARKTA